MRNRIRLKTKLKYQNRIRDAVIDGLGRDVLVYKQPIKSECPNCYYDKLTDKSTNECKWTLRESIQKQHDYEASGGTGLRYKYFARGRCPVCKGKGYLEVQRRAWAKCKVTWDPSVRGYENATVYTAAGTEGSTIVELKTHPKYYNLFKDSTKIIIDGVECKLSRAPILRGLGNQALMIVTAFTTEKPKIGSGEIIKNYV
jgi:hypothetical protein